MRLFLLLVLTVTKITYHTVEVKWDESFKGTATVYYGTISGGPYPTIGCTAKVGVKTCNIKKLTTGTYFLVATETNLQGQTSRYSSEIRVVVP